jgi:UPF0271 protein
VPVERQTIDLNADLGEASDDAGRETERALLGLVTSAHIACGGHAGDEASMREMVLIARDGGVRVGAHPSYPDRAGFGRRPMEMGAGDLAASLRQQIGALVEVAGALGTHVSSVKAHGALYGEVARTRSTTRALLDVVLELCGPDASVVLPAGAAAVEWAQQAGFTVLQEGFADRAYTAQAELVARRQLGRTRLAARHQPGAVYRDPAAAAAQALGLATEGTVAAVDGTVLTLAVDTLCVHGDSPNAPDMARAVRRALRDAGIAVVAPSASAD